MTEKDLKRMTRGELLELLIAQTEENKALRIRLHRAEQQLGERKIAIETAGSIAEASLKLNGVFEAAEAAAAQYLENVKLLNERAESISQSEEEDAKQRAEAIVAEALEYKRRVCAEADSYKKEAYRKVKMLYRARKAPYNLTEKSSWEQDTDE